MYSHLIVSTGWTWDYIDQHMDFPRLFAMDRYWQQHPPLHIMVADFMGIKPSPRAASKPSESRNTQQDLESFMQMFSKAGGAIG